MVHRFKTALIVSIVSMVVVGFAQSVFAYSSTKTSQVFVSQSTAYASGINSTIGANSGVMQVDSTLTGPRMMPMACAGVASNFQVKITTAPGGGGSWTATLRNIPFGNSSTANAAGPTCTISGSNKTCSDSINTGTFAVGEAPILRLASTGNPASTTVSYSFAYTPTTFNCTTLGAGGASMNSTNAQLIQGAVTNANWANLTAPVLNRSKTLVPLSALVQNLYGKIQTAQSVGEGISYVFRNETQNATSTITNYFLSGNTTDTNTSQTATISDGDYIDLMATTTGANTNASGAYGIGLFPLTAGDFAIIGGTQAAGVQDSATLNTYLYFSGRQATTTLADAQGVVNDMNIKKFEITIQVAPGAGSSRNFYLMVNGATTTVSCTISGASATSCAAGGVLHLNDGDIVNYVDEPIGSPATNLYINASAVGTRYFVPAAKHGIFSGFIKTIGGFIRIK